MRGIALARTARRITGVLAWMALAGAALADHDMAPAHQTFQGVVAQNAYVRPPLAEVRIGATFSGSDREVVRTWYGDNTRRADHCPPGLAKKNNGCLPPGQAKKYKIGQQLPQDVVWYPVPPALVLRLPPLPVGYGYIRVGADILLMDRRSNVVVDIAAAF